MKGLPSRRIIGLAVLLGGIIAIAAALYLRPPGGTAPQPVAGMPFGAPFSLADQDGEPVSEAIFRGRPSAVFFGFTNCPDICPATLAEMAAWSKELGDAGKELRFVFVSVDPERDTPAVLKGYLSAFDVAITGITGESQAVAAMLKNYGVYSAKVPLEGGGYTMDHTASVFLLDARGHFFGSISPGAARDEALAKLRRLLAQS